MAARPHVPEFGNWDGQGNVPYTVYFEKARKGRGGVGGKMINPNDPQENPEMFSDMPPSPSPPAAAAPPPSRVRHQAADGINGRGGSVRPQHEPRASREDGSLRPFADSSGSTRSRRTSGESTVHQNSGNRLNHPVRQARPSAGSDYSIERSPMHPIQAKLTGRGGASPAWDGNKNSYDSSGSHGGGAAPGKSRMRQTPRGDESPDGSAAVPRFGEWDETNPQAADNYTHIFNQVREERHSASPNLAAVNKFQSPYPKASKNADGGRKGCFPCLGI